MRDLILFMLGRQGKLCEQDGDQLGLISFPAMQLMFVGDGCHGSVDHSHSLFRLRVG
jgi:hypothetical protein